MDSFYSVPSAYALRTSERILGEPSRLLVEYDLFTRTREEVHPPPHRHFGVIARMDGFREAALQTRVGETVV